MGAIQIPRGCHEYAFYWECNADEKGSAVASDAKKQAEECAASLTSQHPASVRYKIKKYQAGGSCYVYAVIPNPQEEVDKKADEKILKELEDLQKQCTNSKIKLDVACKDRAQYVEVYYGRNVYQCDRDAIEKALACAKDLNEKSETKKWYGVKAFDERFGPGGAPFVKAYYLVFESTLKRPLCSVGAIYCDRRGTPDESLADYTVQQEAKGCVDHLKKTDSKRVFRLEEGNGFINYGDGHSDICSKYYKVIEGRSKKK